jgi:tryptophan synthase alpha chain
MTNIEWRMTETNARGKALVAQKSSLRFVIGISSFGFSYPTEVSFFEFLHYHRRPMTVTKGPIRQLLGGFTQPGRIALMPFIPAGYPDLAATAACIIELEKAGAALLEIGFPFSDPIADGPTIQEAFTEALKKKLKVADIFAMVRQVRKAAALPLVAMVSYSIVYRYGVEKFAADAKTAGFNGILMPDLPPPEAEKVCRLMWAAGLETVLLVAPTTSPDRRAEIARLSTGFVYYLSVAGVTGERAQLPADLPANIAALKKMTDVPICVGFGISTAEHVRQLGELADGAIVGSAMVKRMKQHVSEGPEAIAAAVGEYCRELSAE